VWPAAHPQIYGELRRLEEAGLIEVDSEGPRRRKAYRITDDGLSAVRHWLTSVEVDHTMPKPASPRRCPCRLGDLGTSAHRHDAQRARVDRRHGRALTSSALEVVPWWT
jgi:DNA-binding PadR family transcriptional regulator